MNVEYIAKAMNDKCRCFLQIILHICAQLLTILSFIFECRFCVLFCYSLENTPSLYGVSPNGTDGICYTRE